MNESELEAARGGDEGAFRRLVEPHRAALHAHSYRMLGSRHDADDALQEALFRAWRAISRFEGRGSVRSWLYRIATNTCLDLVARRRRRVLQADHGLPSIPVDPIADAPLNDDAPIDPHPDDQLTSEARQASPETRYEEREAVELAFLAALHHLPPRQRAVLILRDALGFTAREVAGVFDASPAAVNSALQRARATLERGNPDRGEQATTRVEDPQVADTVERFVDAFMQADLEAIIALLAEDIRLSRFAADGNQNGGPARGPLRSRADRDQVPQADARFAIAI
jgi:RNA polymerase sigma-70 factor (ECF subfamily)